MSKKDRPPLAGLSNDDDLARIRAYGLSRGFLPTDTTAPTQPSAPASTPETTAIVAAVTVAQQTPIPAAIVPTPPPSPMIRPAPTKPWQAMFPDYLIEELRNAAAREGTAQKVIVMRALRAAGCRVEDIDLQDLRRR